MMQRGTLAGQKHCLVYWCFLTGVPGVVVSTEGVLQCLGRGDVRRAEHRDERVLVEALTLERLERADELLAEHDLPAEPLAVALRHAVLAPGRGNRCSELFSARHK